MPKISLIWISLFLVFSCSSAQVTGGKPVKEKLADGEYEGKFSNFPNSAEVRVKIKNGNIENIVLIKSKASWIGHQADGIILERIIQDQSTEVDAVTGATNSSRVIMNAVQDAIEKAYKKQE